MHENLKLDLPFSVFFMFIINLFKYFSSIIPIPYVGISALYTTGFCIHKSNTELADAYFLSASQECLVEESQLFPRRTVI